MQLHNLFCLYTDVHAVLETFTTQQRLGGVVLYNHSCCSYDKFPSGRPFFTDFNEQFTFFCITAGNLWAFSNFHTLRSLPSKQGTFLSKQHQAGYSCVSSSTFPGHGNSNIDRKRKGKTLSPDRGKLNPYFAK